MTNHQMMLVMATMAMDHSAKKHGRVIAVEVIAAGPFTQIKTDLGVATAKALLESIYDLHPTTEAVMVQYNDLMKRVTARPD